MKALANMEKVIATNTEYIMQSPTYGELTIKQIVKLVADFILNDESAGYNITIGTDSQTYHEVKMVEVIAVRELPQTIKVCGFC